MRLATSFIAPQGVLAPYLAVGCWGLSISLSGTVVWLVLSSFFLWSDLPDVRNRLAQVESHVPAQGTEPAPSHDKLMALRQRVAVINELAGVQGVPLNTLLAQLEILLPDDVYINSLQYKRRLGEVQLVAEAAQHESLTEFLRNLGKSGNFTEVLLTRQSQRAVGSGKRTQFEVRLRQ